MIFIILGAALVAGETYALLHVARGGTPGFDAFSLLIPITILAAAWIRWPRERMPWVLFAVASWLELNRTPLTQGWPASAVIIGIGTYLAFYGLRTRQVDRGEARAFPQFLLWLAIAMALGWLIHMLR